VGDETIPVIVLIHAAAERFGVAFVRVDEVEDVGGGGRLIDGSKGACAIHGSSHAAKRNTTGLEVLQPKTGQP
jgi:hypothetical protein